MSRFVTYLILIVLSCLSPGPGSVIIVSGQGQKTNIKVLDRSGDWQCASVEERERAQSELRQIAILATAGHAAPHLQWYTRMGACCFYQHD